MENASKALLIAGEILIVIILLSLFAYICNLLGENTSRIYSIMEQTEVAKFNQPFLIYKDRGVVANTTPLTIQDVATLINLVKEKNEKQEQEIKLYLNGTDITNTMTAFNWLEKNKMSDTEYKCTEVHINPNTLYVDWIKISNI